MEYLNRDTAITVTALNEYIGAVMEADPILSSVRVRGEVSNFKRHSSGHLYFSLKDAGGVIRCVMFRSSAATLKFEPADGMKLLLRGNVGVYAPTGQYQLYVRSMEPDGVGALYIAFEKLKEKLGAEGLFDQARKKSLPPYPTNIGIVTSPTGAAIQDMLNILGRRYPLASLTLYPALVQGAEAAQTLIAGIQYFRTHPVDLVIIGRGGGSMEDMWCFNDEGLAREISACEIPIISAVGHEVDFTICDFVADLRAPTPSAAAELAVPDLADLRAALTGALSTAVHSMTARLRLARAHLQRLSDAYCLNDVQRFLNPYAMRVLQLEERAGRGIMCRLDGAKQTLSALSGKVQALSPLAVLSRGYAVTTGGDGNTVVSVTQVCVGDAIRVRLTDGELSAAVSEIKQNGDA